MHDLVRWPALSGAPGAHLVASGQMPAADLLMHAADDGGPFGDHLRYHFFRLHDREDLIQGLRQILRNNTCADARVVYRLHSAGLVRIEGGRYCPAVVCTPITSGSTCVAKQSIYTVGGTVQASGGLYLSRKVDEELLALCRAGTFAYVLTPRQMGKSSLMVHTAERLGAGGIHAAIIDLNQLGIQLTVAEWYLGLLSIIADSLMLETDVMSWWQAHAHLGVTQRLTRFFQEIVLTEVKNPVVIFVDEIDTTLSLLFYLLFLGCHSLPVQCSRPRACVPDRLSFVLIGVATPSDLISDPQRTPFNIGQRVDLTDFTFEEALPLADGLGLPSDEDRDVLQRVMHRTLGIHI